MARGPVLKVFLILFTLVLPAWGSDSRAKESGVLAPLSDAIQAKPKTPEKRRLRRMIPRSSPSQLPGRIPEREVPDKLDPEQLRLDDRAFLAA